MKTKNQLMNQFIVTYGWKPTQAERDDFEYFCDGIATPEVLERVLDPKNHPSFKDGRRPQPSVPTLYNIKHKIITEMFDFKEQSSVRDFYAEFDAEMEGWGCQYCCGGQVWDVVWKEIRWSLERTGLCKHCSQGDFEPRAEVISIMKAKKVPAMHVAGHVFLDIFAWRWVNDAELPEDALKKALKHVSTPF